MKCVVLLLVNLSLLSLIIDYGQSMDLPDFLHVCKRNDPNIVNCITESVEYLKPYLQKGVPEYNIPSLEPLLLKQLIASEKSGLRISAKNVEAYGASDFTITNLKVNLDDLNFAMDIKLPHLHVKGTYEINGKILLLPIDGSGPMTGNFTQCTGSVMVHAMKHQLPNGENHVQIDEFKMRITVGKARLKMREGKRDRERKRKVIASGNYFTKEKKKIITTIIIIITFYSRFFLLKLLQDQTRN